jgi:hypothetical protein
VGGSPHEPIWRCTVTLPTGEVYGSHEFKSKREAEMDAAQIVLNDEIFQSKESSLEHNTCETALDVRSFENDGKVALLIDIENQPKALDEYFLRYPCHSIYVYGFLSRGHPLQRKIERAKYFSDLRFKLCVVPSTRSDGADIGMSMECGKFIAQKMYEMYVIVSNDLFSEALRDCLEGEGVRAYACRSIEYALDIVKDRRFFKNESADGRM